MGNGMGAGEIVRAAIHPSIGVARVGNSATEWFFGPEVTDPLPDPPGFRRDGADALKRQAARFRVYGLDANGNIVAELDAGNADIAWSVHLANKKAAWYEFQLALDIPEASSADPSLLRNASVADRASLTIDPGPRQITGSNAGGGPEHTFDTGSFMGKPVYLGELMTDDKGRLIVLGGVGNSASHDGTPAQTFANNDGWHDDVSDGPVTAEVVFEGRTLEVDPAWIVVGPPNYGPLQKSVRTMWDLMRDLSINNKQFNPNFTQELPARPSFDTDIRPIFERLSALQWVNAGFAAAFGWAAPNDFATPEALARLGSDSPADQPLRQGLVNEFRNESRDAWSPVPWPWMYGDAMNVPTPPTPRAFLALSDTQLKMLQLWADGSFVSDYDPEREPPRLIEDVPVAGQGAMLDRAALDFCLADAFHPGCEITWPVREPTMYMGDFRIAHAPPDWVEPDYGPQLTPAMAAVPAGPPFTGQLPGGLTRWMAVPWQTDTASCRSGYPPSFGPYLATFWPARVPNWVLSRADYEIVLDAQGDEEARLEAFARRSDWLAPLKQAGNYIAQINSFVADISQMSVIETREGIPGDPNFPPVMQVEDIAVQRLAAAPHLLAARADVGAPPEAPEEDLSGIEKVRRFPKGLKPVPA
jgi:hypothetical protein